MPDRISGRASFYGGTVHRRSRGGFRTGPPAVEPRIRKFVSIGAGCFFNLESV